MAYFVFHTFNHTALGSRSLEDPISVVAHQLKALGHRAVWDPTNVSKITDGKIDVGGVKFATGADAYNVIVEGFNADLARVITAVQAAGVKMICLATEEPTPNGFNHGTDRQMRERQAIFPEVGRICEAIWHLVPGQRITDWYGQFAPAAFVELGHAPSLMRLTEEEPTHDFGFFGSPSPRRVGLLRRLQKLSGKPLLLVTNFLPQAERDVVMKRAKVILQLRKTEAMGLVSSARCNTALCLGRPVVAEPHELSHPWDQVIKFAGSEQEFYDLCFLTRGAWRAVAAAQLERFRAKLSPEFCLGPALAQLLEGSGAGRAAA